MYTKANRYLLLVSVINVFPLPSPTVFQSILAEKHRPGGYHALHLHQSRTGGRPGSVMTIRPHHGQSADSLGDVVDRRFHENFAPLVMRLVGAPKREGMMLSIVVVLCRHRLVCVIAVLVGVLGINR